jgi:hypothetical protein
MASIDSSVDTIVRMMTDDDIYPGCTFRAVTGDVTGQVYIWCCGPKYKPGSKDGSGYSTLARDELARAAATHGEAECLEIVAEAMTRAWHAAGYGQIWSEYPFRIYRRGARFMRRVA